MIFFMFGRVLFFQSFLQSSPNELHIYIPEIHVVVLEQSSEQSSFLSLIKPTQEKDPSNVSPSKEPPIRSFPGELNDGMSVLWRPLFLSANPMKFSTFFWLISIPMPTCCHCPTLKGLCVANALPTTEALVSVGVEWYLISNKPSSDL